MNRIFLLLLLLFFTMAFTGETQAKTPKFIGVKKCSKCHKKKKQGNQFSIWKKSKHSQAFKTLGSKKAKKKAANMGLGGDPQKTDACLVCHTSKFEAAQARVDKKFKIEDGVQCETCHGPGSGYRKKKTMKAIYKERGLNRKGDSQTARKRGLIFPDRNTCKRCHVKQIRINGKIYKNPSYKPFNFKKKVRKISHPVPERKG